MLPSRTEADPLGCLPADNVAADLGGFALRSITSTLVVRHLFERVALLQYINGSRRQRHRAARVDRNIDRQPTAEFFDGRGATIFRFSRVCETSTIRDLVFS